MGKIVFVLLSKLFKLEYIEKVLYRPEGCQKWGYSETKDMVYSIYVTRRINTSRHHAFGFWVNDESLSKGYLRASIMALKNIF